MFAAVANLVNEVVEFIDSRNKIWVTLDKLSYVGGDVVQGVVHLNCLVPFQARGVLVKVKGFAKACWEERRTKRLEDGRTESFIHLHSESNEFFCERIRVYPYEGVVNQGEYHFPFSYQLPATLPGTFREGNGLWSTGNAYSAEIIYFAQAKIDVKFKHDLKNKVCFVVNEKFDKLLQPSFGENNKTFLFTKGRLSAKVWLDKNAYFPGNTVIAKLEANNTSVKPTNRLNVYVYKHLSLHAHGHDFSKRNEIYKQTYGGFEPSFFGVRWLPFQIPVNIQPSTTTSRLVKCHYFFVVECDIPGAIDLSVELSTRILAPQWLFSNLPPAPPSVALPPDVSYRPPWQPDEQAPQCNRCHTGFSLFNRRHHCRNCGKIYCKNCCNQKLNLINLGYAEEPVLVCEGCLPDARQTGGKHFQEAQVLDFTPPEEYTVPSAPPLEQ